AHELADRVTAVATAELSASVLHAASRRLRRSAGIVSEALDDASVALEAALDDAAWPRSGLGSFTGPLPSPRRREPRRSTPTGVQVSRTHRRLS
ncbi:hypothetical protein AB0941_42720, partial [Streptomyces sp. NPDC013433]|uniref:hypothetical protein n=1 Tax=Streptomyces sp. NPDC013433 TaxID=3155604 RepID=UPI00345352A3